MINFIKLGREISKLRELRKLTQLELAGRINISERTLGKIAHGGDLKLSRLDNIVTELNIPLFEY
ncbi:MAG: helix-turn-helix domain-containing protein [Shewanella sp.]